MMIDKWFDWFRRKEDSEIERQDRLLEAKMQKARAKKEHGEVVKLIRLLEIEHQLNNYAQLVESALRAERQAKRKKGET